MSYLTDQNMTPELGQQAAMTVHNFIQKWEPEISQMKTDMGSVAKSIGDAVVKSRSR